MAAVLFDTAEYIEDLEKEGVEHRQARAFVNVVRRSQEAVLENQVKTQKEISAQAVAELDSKTAMALQALDHKIDKGLSEISNRFTETDGKIALLHKDMAALENRLIIKLSIVMAALFGIIGGITATVVRLMLP